MKNTKQERNKNEWDKCQLNLVCENINDGNNGNDERNINLDCPASSLGNRDVHNINGKKIGTI